MKRIGRLGPEVLSLRLRRIIAPPEPPHNLASFSLTDIHGSGGDEKSAWDPRDHIPVPFSLLRLPRPPPA